MSARWEVLTLVGNEYENCWSVWMPGGMVPLTFATKEEAEAELKEHRRQLALSGMTDDDSYRIQEINPTN